MILYHAISSYQLLSALTLNAASAEEGVVMIPNWILQKFPQYKILETYFKKVIVFDAVYRFSRTKEENDQYFYSILGELDQYSKIYVWAAHFSFGIFMAEQEMPFIFCEDAAGLLSRPDTIGHIDAISEYKGKYHAYMKGLGLYTGECKNVQMCLCNKDAQIPGFHKENLLHFSVVDGLFALNDDKRKSIMQFFVDINRLSIMPESTILFTQHLSNLHLATFEEQALIYEMFVDYFVKTKNLVIKPHPDDLMYYAQLFPGAQIIRERFPAEFLPFILDHDPKCIATLYSASVYNLRGHYPEVFELDARYEKDFIKTHRYYAALMVAKKLDVPVYYVGTNEVLMEKLGERIKVSGCVCTGLSELPAGDEPCTIIVDDLTEQGDAGRDAVRELLRSAWWGTNVVFVNTQSDYCWYSIDSKELWEHMLPIKLQKKLREDAPREDFYESLQDEIIYVYSLNDQMLKEVNELSFEKPLPHVGINVEKIPLTSDEERVKILEGVLEATEQRLLYYINRVKELEKKGR